MFDYGLPALYTVFVWWFATGLVLYLDGLPARTFRWSMAGATALLVAAVIGLAMSRAHATAASAYVAFTSGLLVWGWLEMAYFTGMLTGPRKAPCPLGCSIVSRFRLALGTSLYHELAVIITGAALLTWTWQSANRIGAWTFLILWTMRWSTKLNVFLGVRNLNEEWLPQHLRFLHTYFKKRPMNLLFPLSVTVSTVIGALLVMTAAAADADPFTRTGYSLLAMLMTLAILEHWFLVLPLPTDALWRWGMGSRAGVGAASDCAQLGSRAARPGSEVARKAGAAAAPG